MGIVSGEGGLEALMELIVTKLPLRKGYWLAFKEGSTVKALAKFRSTEAAAEFMGFLELNNGKPLNFKCFVED